MRLLHTADWHLGDRLGRIDRTDDLRRRVEQIADYCREEDVDVLLVAGDLFSEMSRADGLSDTIGHLRDTFRPFLGRGGTILAVTGNHDNETFCRTLRHALDLGTPASLREGAVLPPGRLHLADTPALWSLADRSGGLVQFALMPYPTSACYLDGPEEATRYARREEKNRALRDAFARRLAGLRASSAYRSDLPSVLVAHAHIRGARISSPFRMSESEELVVPEDDAGTTAAWAYVALGHIHRAQALHGREHVRYCGSIDRLDQGEREEDKGVVLVEIDPSGRVAPPRILPLEASPMLDLEIHNATIDLPNLEAIHGLGAPHLVRYRLHHRPGVDDLDAVLSRIDALFPRWHDREIVEAGAEAPRLHSSEPHEAAKGIHEIVLEYLEDELIGHPDRDAILALAETTLAEQGLR